MSTHISMTYTCPRCEEGITAAKRPENCPGCGYTFAARRNYLRAPHTLTEQREGLGDDSAHLRFLLDLPIEKANSMLNDALDIVRTIPAKKVSASDIRILMGMAKSIGEIALKYEEFLAAGGVHTPGLLLSKGAQNEPQKTTDGGKPRRGLTEPM